MKKLLKFGCAGIVGIVVLLVILGTLSSKPADSKSASGTVTAKPTTIEQAKAKPDVSATSAPKVVEVKATEVRQPTSSPATSTPKPSPAPTQTVAPKPTATEIPALTLETFPAHLEKILPAEAKGKVSVDADGAFAQFNIADGFMLDTAARKYARDFVFAAYASGLPLKSVQIVIGQPDGKLGLSITLGANVASTQPQGTWTDRAVGPTIFINWMKDKAKLASNKPGADRAFIGGPWSN